MATFFVCVLIADFITGLVHWFEDTYGLPTWPILGKLVIEPNIEHHKRPGLMGRMGTAISRNLQPVLLGAIAFPVLIFFFDFWPLLLTTCLAALGNEVHAWNHRSSNNRVITFLQDSGLVQSAKHHSKHHREPYDKYFCTLTNFTNEVLELICFWRGLEWAIAFVFRVQPKRLSALRGGV